MVTHSKIVEINVVADQTCLRQMRLSVLDD
jgi:hypothetical protein